MINIKVPASEEKEDNNWKKLNVRKTFDNKLMIFDHEDLDIVIDPEGKRVLIFSTDMKNTEKTYVSKDRLFNHLIKKGIVEPDSVKFGNVYGCLEGNIKTIKDPKYAGMETDLTLMEISKWIHIERPTFLYVKQKEQEWEDDLLKPSEEESTNYGEVPQEKMKDVKDVYASGNYPYFLPPYEE